MSTVSYMNAFLVQESISLMFVALGLAIVGFAYGRLKTDESLRLHRWIMSGAVILTMVSIGFVMVPSLWLYYAVPNTDMFSNFSILQIVHSVEGIPTLTLSILYLFNRLPKPTHRWMQLTAVLWVLGVALGAVVYYTMPS